MDEHTCGYEHDPATTTCAEAEAHWEDFWGAEAKAEMEAEQGYVRMLESSGWEEAYMDRQREMGMDSPF